MNFARPEDSIEAGQFPSDFQSASGPQIDSSKKRSAQNFSLYGSAAVAAAAGAGALNKGAMEMALQGCQR